MEYRRRLVDELLDEFLPHQPATVISGARAVGKSATAERRAQTVYRLDLPEALDLARADPGLLTTGATPILIDEWRRYPASWDLVRRTVDDDPTPGRFLLTASASPIEQTAHPGTGRYLFIQMRPMSLVERGLALPSVSLAALLTGERGGVAGSTEVTLRDYAEEIERSGFPAIRNLPPALRQRRLGSYLETTYTYAIADAGKGKTRHDPKAMRRWARSYAAATATTASWEAIRDGATGGQEDKPSFERTAGIRSALEGAHVVEPVEAWLPSFNFLHTLGQAPKHHLVDPALAARLRGVRPTVLLQAGGLEFASKQRPFIGALFESLVAQSVRTYAEVHDWSVYHLRTHAGRHEVDLIVERDDGGVVALEVKLAAVPDDDDFKHLRWLEREIGDQLLDAAVITTGQYAYRESGNGFAVIPAALLGP